MEYTVIFSGGRLNDCEEMNFATEQLAREAACEYHEGRDVVITDPTNQIVFQSAR